MDWDQILFRKIYHFWQRLWAPPPDHERLARTSWLKDLTPRLGLLAKALTGRPIQIYRAEAEGGLASSTFFLPESFGFFGSLEENQKAYLFRLCFLSAQVLFSPPGSSKDTQPSALGPSEIQAILRRMWNEWPGLLPWAADLLQKAEEAGDAGDPTLLRGLFGKRINDDDFSHVPIHHRPFEEPAPFDDETPAPPTEKQAPAREEVKILQIDQKATEDYTLMHSFEKIETLDDFNGQWRDLDGTDEMEAHEEALQELDLRQMVRTDSIAHSVYQAERTHSGAIPETASDDGGAACFLYPEWDASKKIYRPDHCKVFPALATDEDQAYVTKALQTQSLTLRRLRQTLARFRNEREARRAQTDGEFPDLDAVVDAYASMRAGRSPDERMYLSKRLHRRDTSVLILMDISLSTDAYAQGRRIMDVEKQALLTFGSILEEQGEAFRIDAFWSRTRNQCNYVHLKDFRTPWKEAAGRLAALRPTGYTRIGPALRHATAQIERESSRHRWILLLSDGKPNDYDRYEGEYGVQDVRAAIREAKKKGIQIFSLALEPRSRDLLPQIFGPDHYKLLARPEDLPEAMLFFYTRLLSCAVR